MPETNVSTDGREMGVAERKEGTNQIRGVPVSKPKNKPWGLKIYSRCSESVARGKYGCDAQHNQGE